MKRLRNVVCKYVHGNMYFTRVYILVYRSGKKMKVVAKGWGGEETRTRRGRARSIRVLLACHVSTGQTLVATSARFQHISVL